jgi:NAD(P)-dependent dehydrogenase (short-subunit alcohol dehydrogenase family)
VVIGARDPQAAAAVVSELDGVRSYAGSLDIADPESVYRAATLWAEDIGLLDILINNATAYVDWSEMASTADLDAAERAMQVNLFGIWRMIQAFCRC